VIGVSQSLTTVSNVLARSLSAVYFSATSLSRGHPDVARRLHLIARRGVALLKGVRSSETVLMPLVKKELQKVSFCFFFSF
jgi:hypothetical protein